jgi:hypothetical protein
MASPISPLISHPLLAALYTVVLGFAAKAVHLSYPWVVAAIVVSAFWYGREAGQREHDLKNMGVRPIPAWLGAEFAYRWNGANWAQWLVAAASSAAVAAALTWAAL